jgi:DHA3 family multidrug efflux protein-like MFS transporter
VHTFNKLLYNTLIASVTNNFLWFAVTFWAYLETRSVLATSIIGGSYMLLSAVLGLYFGTYVDRHRKKAAMLYSSIVSLAAFVAAGALYMIAPHEELLRLSSLEFWSFVVLVLAGAVAGNMRAIALSTTVTLLVPEKDHDKANGLVGTVNGVSFAITSVFSGLAIGYLGMGWSLVIAIILTMVAALHLMTVKVKEKLPKREPGSQSHFDVRGAIAAVLVVPGLLALIFFTTFNNFLGGVFMSLMDAYGLNLVSVQVWGLLWGVLSCAFIAGGIIVAKRGLGRSPLRTLFLCNIAMWIVSIIFPIKASIVLAAIGMFVYMLLIPAVEAAEQTIVQKVVPLERQGRVFGFAQSLENAASPITAFMIGPLAELFFIPYMSEGGAGAVTIGSWFNGFFGVGPDRGMALVFILAGLVGLIVTLMCMSSRSYLILNRRYAGAEPVTVPVEMTPRT